MLAVLGSIISSPAAGMSPLRAAAAVVSDGGGEIVLLRVGRRSMRRDLNRIQRQRCRTIPTDRLRSATLCGRRMRHHSSPSCLGRQALQVAVTISTAETADLAINQNPAKTDVQSASGFFAPTPVSPDCRTNLR